MSNTTVIVVTHNSAGVVDDCLRSCSGLNVLVIDNASSDETVDRVRRHAGVRLISNSENLGFAGGVNQGVRACAGDFLLLLNPDARLADSIQPLVDAAEGDPQVGMTAGLLTDEEGRAQIGFSVRRFPAAATLIFEVLGINRILPRNRVNRAYRYLDRNIGASCEVDQPAGAFLLFRRELWERLDGFDERFHPVWFEDVDFCLRAKAAGYRTLLVPGVHARHAGGHSVGKLTRECRELYWYGSLLKYAAKHFPAHEARAISAAVVLGSVLRAIAGAAVTRSLTPFKIYSKVIRAACSCMVSGRVPDVAC